MMGLMRKISVYIFGVLLVAVSCVNEQNIDVIPSAGDEVKFAAEMGESVATKTLYGADAPKAIMVKWVNGDKIKVFGTTCAVQEADYVVSVDGVNTPNVNDGKNIADGLTKTGEAGVQWGTADVSDFIAIYPSDKAVFAQNGNTVKSTIPSEQNYVFTPLEDNVQNRHWEGTNFSTDRNNPTMGDAIMYAYTSANKSDLTVPLRFKPLTTVLKFRFMGYEYGSELAEDETISVQSITVTAPEGYAISGDFNISFSDGDPDVETAGNNSNSITLNTMLPDGLYLKMQKGDVVDFNVFTIPLEGNIGGDITRLKDVEKKDAEGNTITDEQGKAIMVNKYTCEYPWTITIKTAGHGSFKYTTIPNHSDINKLAEGQKLEIEPYALAPGMIHKIKVPQMIVDKKVVWNPENWITQVPPPVYISELSVPGAWYCTNSAYQNHTSLSDLYNAGIRAFHIDCRVTKTAGTYGWFSKFNSGDNAYLAVAGTESSSTGVGSITLQQGVNVVDLVKQIVALAKQHQDEYVVIVLTIADQPKNDSDQTIMGSVAPSIVMPYIEAMLNNTDQISYVLNNQTMTTSISASLYRNISADTTIEDVLGEKNVIVKVNSNTDQISSLATAPNTLISFASMASDSNYNTSNDEITNLSSDYFSKMNSAPLFVGKQDVKLTYYYHQAQRTTSNSTSISGVPTLDMRIDAIDDIIDKSSEVYKNSLHNSWFQMGIGGFVKNRDGLGASENHETVSEELNSHLYNRIVEKMDTDPSPVGLVLMNHSTTEATVDGKKKVVGNDLVKAIIEMNGKFYLNRRGNDVTTGGGTSGQELDTKAAAYVGPDAF